MAEFQLDFKSRQMLSLQTNRQMQTFEMKQGFQEKSLKTQE